MPVKQNRKFDKWRIPAAVVSTIAIVTVLVSVGIKVQATDSKISSAHEKIQECSGKIKTLQVQSRDFRERDIRAEGFEVRVEERIQLIAEAVSTMQIKQDRLEHLLIQSLRANGRTPSYGRTD